MIYIRYQDRYTDDEWAEKLGLEIKMLRLKKNLSQEALAEGAGVSMTALKNLESGTGASVKTLIKILRELKKLPWIETLDKSEEQVTRERATKEKLLKK